MYALEVKEGVDKIFQRLARKNLTLLEITNKKILEIRKNPWHSYKFLRSPLQGFNRVHISKNFVLIFKIDKNSEKIIVYHFDHHDNVYKWRPSN